MYMCFLSYGLFLGFGGRFATLVTHPGEFVVDAAVAFHPAGLAVPAELEPISRPLLIVVCVFAYLVLNRYLICLMTRSGIVMISYPSPKSLRSKRFSKS